MKSTQITRLLSATVLAVSAIFATPSQASPFSSLVVFGDSLSDSGNVASLGRYDPTQIISGNTYIPDNAYAFGTLSNGPVWATQFAALIGLPLAPSAVPPLPYGGGSNYAFASARTGAASAGNPAPSLLDQRDMYLGVSLGAADPAGLYVVAGGGNNARDALEDPAFAEDPFGTAGAYAAQFAADIESIVHSLQVAGAQHIVVWNTPNLGVVPAVAIGGAPAIGAATLVAQFMNTALAESMMDEPGVDLFDLDGFFGSVLANPARFGYTNVTDACGAPINNCDPATALFWDGVHPTTKTHGLLAQAMFTATVPEPATYTLVALGLAAVGFGGRRRKALA
jgi:outer membrane lipase/esterase